MSMKLSQRGWDALIKEEGGLQLKAYPDAGYWAIALGCQTYQDGRRVKEGDTLSEWEAIQLAQWHVAQVEAGINALVKVPLTQNQFNALVSFTYNVGLDIDEDTKAEGFGDSTLLKLLNQADYTGAADQFVLWNKSQGEVNKVLVARRAREREMFLTPDAPETGFIDTPITQSPPSTRVEPMMPTTPAKSLDTSFPEIITGLIRTAAKAVPEIGKLFLDTALSVPQRNIAAASTALDIIAQATKPVDVPKEAWNTTAAVQTIVNDPIAAATARNAVLGEYERLLGMITQAQQADELSRDRAVARAKTDTWDMLPFLADKAFKLIASALILEVTALIIGLIMKAPEAYMGALLALFIATMTKLVDRWGQLYDYRIGSSLGSKMSGDAVRALAEKQR